jgi:hypothetical protein
MCSRKSVLYFMEAESVFNSNSLKQKNSERNFGGRYQADVLILEFRILKLSRAWTMPTGLAVHAVMWALLSVQGFKTDCTKSSSEILLKFYKISARTAQ